VVENEYLSCQTMYPQFLQQVADTGWGPQAQRLTFCKEQERDLENVASTPVQPPGTLFCPIFMTLLIRVHSENNSRMYFLIVLTTDYCWRSWTCRIVVPYKSRVDWLIDCWIGWLVVKCYCCVLLLSEPSQSFCSLLSTTSWPCR